MSESGADVGGSSRDGRSQREAAHRGGEEHPGRKTVPERAHTKKDASDRACREFLDMPPKEEPISCAKTGVV